MGSGPQVMMESIVGCLVSIVCMMSVVYPLVPCVPSSVVMCSVAVVCCSLLMKKSSFFVFAPMMTVAFLLCCMLCSMAGASIAIPVPPAT